LDSGNVADVSTEVIDGLFAHGKPFHSPTAHITAIIWVLETPRVLSSRKWRNLPPAPG